MTLEILSKYRSTDMVPVICAYCKVDFFRTKKAMISQVKTGQTRFFCSRKCAWHGGTRVIPNGRGPAPKIINLQCSHCNITFTRREGVHNRRPQDKVFCSSVCVNAARFIPQPICTKCGERPAKRRCQICEDCIRQKRESMDTNTLGDLLYREGPSSKEAKWSKVRARARTKFQNEIKLGCENCGYKKHVDVAHIRGITTFPLETLVSVVNDRSNILFMCRNCHWEMDHNMLDNDAPVKMQLMRFEIGPRDVT